MSTVLRNPHKELIFFTHLIMKTCEYIYILTVWLSGIINNVRYLFTYCYKNIPNPDISYQKSLGKYSSHSIGHGSFLTLLTKEKFM